MRIRLALGLAVSSLVLATPPAYAVNGTLDFSTTVIELWSADGAQSILVIETRTTLPS